MTDNSLSRPPDFAERLVSVEPLPAGRKSELQQELSTMFEQELTNPRRVVFAVVAVVALASAAVCGFLAVTEPALPLAGRVGLGVGTLFGLGWAIVVGRILKKGSIDRIRDNKLIAQMAWIFTVLMVVFFLYVGMTISDRLLGVMLIGQALAFLIGAAVGWLTFRIEQSELSTREKLLQIELLLAELHEKH
jgi:MFS family permease